MANKASSSATTEKGFEPLYDVKDALAVWADVFASDAIRGKSTVNRQLIVWRLDLIEVQAVMERLLSMRAELKAELTRDGINAEGLRIAADLIERCDSLSESAALAIDGSYRKLVKVKASLGIQT